MFRFNHAAILDILEKSIFSSQIEVDKKSMLEDLVNCTCMISRDGLEYIFSHPSFQEYFTAYFVARVKSEEIGRVTPKLVARDRSDNVILMMSEMNREQFEETWVLPQLRRIWEVIKDIDPDKRLVDYMCALREARQTRFIIQQDEKNSRYMIRWPFSSSRYEGREESLASAMFVIHKIYDLYEIMKSKVEFADDSILISEIKSGALMAQAKRFESIRTDSRNGTKQLLGGDFLFEVRAKRADNRWLSRTNYAKWSATERLVLKELLDEIDARVAARSDGLIDILGLR